ncbi:hypothetical protein ACGFIW_12660 [Micromonospora sp. NPDC048935]|uniref:hypothetical protein n=1 Tax=Micromonospora sp. NPDC048935 TaxID=3364262 RepID=UPI00371D2E15
MLINAADAALAKIDQSVQPSAADYQRFQAKADEVADVLVRSGVCAEYRLVGSVARATALGSHSDVDLLAILGTAEQPHPEPRQGIADLAATLTAAGIMVEPDDFVASAKFARPPAVDVMPAIRHVGQNCYLIPAGRNNEWQTFSPTRLKTLTERSIRRLGARFVSVVRLLKLWNISREARLESSDLEELASLALEDLHTLPPYSQCLAQILSLCASWVGGDMDTENRMGRPPPSRLRNAHTLAIIKESTAIALAMQQTSRKDVASGFVEEFFGGKFAGRAY